MRKRDTIIIVILIILFGAASFYLLFINTSTSKYDSKTRAYQISPNATEDSDGDTIYYPSYFFKVKRKDYECKSKSGNSSYPSEKKNIVYYDSSNPNKCMTEYEKSSNRFGGFICLFFTIVLIIALKAPANNNKFNQDEKVNEEMHQKIEENAQKVLETVDKIQLIVKRIILGIIILILALIVAFNTAIFIQTIKAKDFIETTATYVDIKDYNEESSFDDYIYTFNDKNGTDQEIILSLAKTDYPKDEIKIKYNENNPQDYYSGGETMDTKGIIWYIVEIVILILLITLFFNKKLLGMIGVSISKS